MVILKAVVQLPELMIKPDSIDLILKENKADLPQTTILNSCKSFNIIHETSEIKVVYLNDEEILLNCIST